ncbi:MAG: DUF3592 domain-containing protein [Pseudomonadota bacterium]
MSRKPSPKAGAGCLGLFGGVFAIAGLVPGGMGLFMLFNAWQASSWTATPATLTQLELATSRSDDGGNTYALRGRFRYEYNGQRYVSDQLDFSLGSDNIGDYHRDNYSRLQPSLNVPSGLTAFVNPDRPDQAVLLREVRWGMVAFLLMFLAIFGGVGITIIGVGVVGARKLKAERQLQQAHPDEPWRWEPEWEHGEIHCAGKARMWVAVSMATFWNLISTAVWFFLPEELAKGNYLALIALLFPAVGIGFIVWAAVSVARWRRYGRSTLVLPELPLRLGARLEGHLRVSTSLDARQVSLTLTCVEVRISGSGKNRSTHRTVLYQDEAEATVQPAAGHRRVPVSFALPADQPERDVSDSRHKIEWHLKATARVRGPDLDISFELPVFEADMLSPISNLGQVAESDAADPDDRPVLAAAEDGGDAAATGVDMHYRGGGLRYYFAPARHLAVGSGFTGAGLVAGGIAVFGTAAGKLPLVGTIVCGLLGSVFLLVGLNELLMRSEVRTRIGELGVRRGWWLGQDRYYRLADIEDLQVTDGMQVGETRYYRLTLKTRDGKLRVLAGGLKGRRNTVALRNLIADAVGLK